MSQKYVVGHFIDLPSEQFNFSCKNWPLHITLLPNFTINNDLDQVINKLELLSSKIKPFIVQVGNNEHFGLKGEVLVSLIKPNASIINLHEKLVGLTRDYKFDTPQYINAGYRPHATKKPNCQLNKNEIYEVNSMTLVDMYPKNNINRRAIIKNFMFGA